jgi:hypothetical protein
LGLRLLGIVASHASHSAELGALGLCRAPDPSADASPAAAAGSSEGAIRPRDADGALAVSPGPAASGRPHRGQRWRVGAAAHQTLVF